jgi:hypothetical protein
MDFITRLPLIGPYDTLLVVVDKFTKHLGLLPGSSNWNAEHWGIALVKYFQSHDWGIPRFFISDCDVCFMSEFWQGMVTALKSK